MQLTKSGENSSSLPVQAMQSVDQATHLLERAAQQTSTLTHRGMDSVRETSHQLRVKAEQVSENTVHHIQQNPVKAMLIAAATGAGLMALVHLVSRSHDHH